MPEVDVVRLVASGMTFTDVAYQLGCSSTEAAERVAEALRDGAGRALDKEEARQVELAHLDMIRRAMTPAALKGDDRAARVLVRVAETRAELLGLTAAPPGETEREEGSGDVDPDELRARRDARRAATGTSP